MIDRYASPYYLQISVVALAFWNIADMAVMSQNGSASENCWNGTSQPGEQEIKTETLTVRSIVWQRGLPLL